MVSGKDSDNMGTPILKYILRFRFPRTGPPGADGGKGPARAEISIR